MIRAVLVDVEGTTSSLSAVRDVLFPYARERLADWAGSARPGVAEIVGRVSELSGRPASEAVAVLRDWIDRDVKAAPLKELQGLIWAAGFEAGELSAHVYDDVPPALRAWTGAGLRVYVYSSGSVVAQRVWFANTRHGDLSAYLSGHFDIPSAGPKREPCSYRRIAGALGVPPGELVFLSDTLGELDAARAAGLRTVGVSRPQDGSPGTTGHLTVPAFDRLDLDGDRPRARMEVCDALQRAR
ncbi:acireductone synthase [Nonomuraea sp. MG754425]|uniref:acireductone synthase n=1 Tax=Nonomuraea sp. MG754425 TaxID=2570319 RepID=UPI001F006480|nr:acireductone synthase [Nonomuraea sp. MG754425]MCF6469982.1 acireductone synthase [Nonomuraea sp. MG754425]